MVFIKNNSSIIFRSLLILSLLLIFVCISAYSYVSAVSYDIASSVFRLHVIANSDSKEDQDLKYLVRDSLLNYMNSITSNSSTKQETIDLANEHINDFYKIAEETIKNAGYDYPVNITIGEYNFPTKQYGDVSLPAGTYDALRVEIGSASGRNWWCVMFPPLCFVDVSSGIVPDDSKEMLQDGLSDEEYDLITTSDNSNDINFKFKIIEFIEGLKIGLSK